MMSSCLRCVVTALCCALPWLALADERILDYQSDIQIHASGELTITETIRVRAEGRDIRRGIYRDFPTRYRDRWGNHVTAAFQPLALRRNGQAEPWHSQQRSNGVRVYFGSANRLLEPGIHEYEFVFATNRQLGFFDDHDELYFNAIGLGWQFPIERAAVTVTLPFAVTPGDLRIDVYGGGFGGGVLDALITRPSANTVAIEAAQALGSGEGLTVAIAWPKGLIAEPEMTQTIRWFLGDNAAALALIAGWLVALAWYLWAWIRVGRDPARGVVIPRFEPPADLSPAACSYVSKMSFSRDAFSAAIISLAVKGQLRIEEYTEDAFALVRRADAPAAPLTPGERAVLGTLLPASSSRIEMDNENHADFLAAQKALKGALKKEYLGRLFHLNGIYLAPPILISVTAAIVALFLHGSPPVWIAYAVLTLALHALFLFLMRSPTPDGRRVMDEIEGFRRYLGTAEQDRLERMRSPALTPEVFEAFLPYAYALGVENSWCKRFATELPADPGQRGSYHPVWYYGQFHGMSALNHLGSDFGGSFSSAIASASTPPGSSSGSGGGGFSGGGGGGGGGGGW